MLESPLSHSYFKTFFPVFKLKNVLFLSILFIIFTPFKVIDESNGNGYFWVTRSTKEFSKHQITMFHYYNTRAGKTIGQILGQQYSGVIMCDGYGGYSDRLYPQAKFGSCLVHIRREFYRITCLLKKEQLKNSKAYQVLQLMRPDEVGDRCKRLRQ